MAKCIYCGSETELYDGNVPICIKCCEEREAKSKLPRTEERIRAVLVKRVAEATARLSSANELFSTVINHFPSGVPHPDGSLRVKKASSDLSAARAEMMEAHKRLTDFIERGIVPEDLKRTS